jgi:hypothetical protein
MNRLLALAVLVASCGGTQPSTPAPEESGSPAAPGGDTTPPTTGAPGGGGDPPAGYNPCGAKKCGDSCTICAPDAKDCVETAVVKMCQPDGKCDATTPKCN